MASTVADIKTQIALRQAKILDDQGKENLRVEELDRLLAHIIANEGE